MSRHIHPPPAHAKDRIEAINDEVKEFHPILGRLFRAMDYQAVEYTHGPSEQGADFIITDYDHKLRINKYIGVIAKTSRILGSTVDIENQIKQCASRRFIEGGKKEIRVSSIYVVTSKSISHNAERSIHESYATQNVEFFDRDRLIELINEYIPDFWYDIPSDVGEYLTYLRTKNEQNDKSLSILTNKDITYISQDVVRHDDDIYSQRSKHKFTKRELVDLHKEVLDHKFIFVEGNVGSGKSKLLRRLISHYSDPETYKTSGVIPIFLNFREFYDDYDCNVKGVIEGVLECVSRAVDLNDKKILLIIDAFDEKILEYSSRCLILDKLKEASSHGKIHILVASRHLFNGITSPTALKVASRYEIAPLSTRKLIRYMESLCKSFNINSRVLEDIKRSHLMKDIPRSPVAAIILAQLMQESGQDLPSNLTELYSKYIELTLGRWDIQKGIRSQKEYEIIENILMQFAVESIRNEIQSTTIAGFKEVIKHYCSSRQLGISQNELFNLIKERSDIIVVNESSNQVLFKHRSFAEFLYAKHLIRSQSYNVDDTALDVYWANIHFFSFGILKDAPVQLKKLYSLKAINDSQKFLKAMYIGDYLMAAYQTPYDIIKEGVELAASSYGELYLDIVENRSKLLNNLPRMVLLYLFQLMFKHNYDYEFLKKALDEAGTNIAAVNAPHFPYSLFFIDAALIESERAGNFRLLMETCGTSVPTDLALAIRHETKDLKTNLESIKKSNKKIQRMLRDKNSQLYFAKIYDIPIRDMFASKGNKDK